MRGRSSCTLDGQVFDGGASGRLLLLRTTWQHCCRRVDSWREVLVGVAGPNATTCHVGAAERLLTAEMRQPASAQPAWQRGGSRVAEEELVACRDSVIYIYTVVSHLLPVRQRGDREPEVCSELPARRCVPPRRSSYLVDPASSHMLVSKTKPCMSKYERFVL